MKAEEAVLLIGGIAVVGWLVYSFVIKPSEPPIPPGVTIAEITAISVY